uniref:Uncharacterized protein n=1 Tax=Spongospora subterranea TaxID=70186 RepID=A0A0H5QZR8_9EUKA|eukprot:CRZ07469.1 hypothetical protein [Spongospora subterranea]
MDKLQAAVGGHLTIEDLPTQTAPSLTPPLSAKRIQLHLPTPTAESEYITGHRLSIDIGTDRPAEIGAAIENMCNRAVKNGLPACRRHRRYSITFSPTSKRRS